MSQESDYEVDKYGNQRWRADMALHRTDGPAVIMADGDRQWWIKGQLHRVDGPAYITCKGKKEWWINGERITVKVERWMKLREISWPWDELTQVEFQLTWL